MANKLKTFENFYTIENIGVNISESITPYDFGVYPIEPSIMDIFIDTQVSIPSEFEDIIIDWCVDNNVEHGSDVIIESNVGFCYILGSDQILTYDIIYHGDYCFSVSFFGRNPETITYLDGIESVIEHLSSILKRGDLYIIEEDNMSINESFNIYDFGDLPISMVSKINILNARKDFTNIEDFNNLKNNINANVQMMLGSSYVRVQDGDSDFYYIIYYLGDYVFGVSKSSISEYSALFHKIVDGIDDVIDIINTDLGLFSNIKESITPYDFGSHPINADVMVNFCDTQVGIPEEFRVIISKWCEDNHINLYHTNHDDTNADVLYFYDVEEMFSYEIIYHGDYCFSVSTFCADDETITYLDDIESVIEHLDSILKEGKIKIK